jgi:hypothetical protein
MRPGDQISVSPKKKKKKENKGYQSSPDIFGGFLGD